MIDTYSVPLTQLVQEFKLIPAYRSSDYEAIRPAGLAAGRVFRPL